jgi:hypothetical protein
MIGEGNWFEQGVYGAKKYFSWLVNDTPKTRQKLHKYFSADYQEILTISGLNVTPLDVLLFSYTSALLSFLLCLAGVVIILVMYLFFSLLIDGLTLIILGGILIGVPIVVMNYIATYPKTHSRYNQIYCLGDIPEVLSYLVMYLKLVPNLENSVRFAASESTTTLAKNLRKLIWDMEIRVYHGITDALTSFATQWGRWSDYFKRSLHLIGSSIQERDETARIITLDRALDVSLEGTQETMNQFAARLHQPTVILYSLGIMIPLSLVAMLPAAGLVGMRITIGQVFVLYDVLLPLFVLLFIHKILLTRPVTFTPSTISSDHPDLRGSSKHRSLVVSLVLGIVVSLPGFIFLLVPFVHPTDSSNGVMKFLTDPQGLNSFFPCTLFFIWGVAAAVSSYCIRVYRPYKKVRDEIKQMEREFSDALYILGKRISEEKSPEDSFLYTAKTMQGTKIAEVFHHTCFNLMALHTNFHDALFSSEFGSLRHVYSDRIKAILQLFIEGTQKSQRVVSASIIRIADHLKQLQLVEKKLQDMLYELTSTLQSTITVFAPLIAGVTLSITTLISRILGSVSISNSPEMIPEVSPGLVDTSQAFMIKNIQPEYFVLVIGMYLIELVFLLTRFTNGINEGNDKAIFMYRLGKIMPLSIIVFSVTLLCGQFFFSQMMPSV